MPKKPVLTDDAHLHGKSAEHVYRAHHAMNTETGESLPGAEAAEDECGCAHCVSHVEQDEAVLDDAKELFATSGPALKSKTSKRRR